jgi:phosphotransferase system HPr (HPr) family protein
MPVAEAYLVIKNKVGLHARPARLLVQTAAQFQSRIQLQQGEKSANAKSIIGVLKLGAVFGDVLVLRAEGEDAEKAVKTLTELVDRKFDEEEGIYDGQHFIFDQPREGNGDFARRGYRSGKAI